MSILRITATIVVIVLLIGLLPYIAHAKTVATPPPPTVGNPSSGGGGGGGSISGGGSSYTPLSATPTPTPTPVPPYRLDTPLPSKTDIGNVPVRIEGNTVTVPQGYLFQEVVKNDTLEVPLAMVDGAPGKLVMTIEPADSRTGTIKAMELVAEKTLKNGTQEIGVTVEVSLAQFPEGSSIDFDLLSPGSVDVNRVNEQLSAYSDKSFNTTPLLAFKATKNGLQNGRDIKSVKLTFKVPRPENFDPAASYYVLRENDGAYDLLNATLTSSPDANPLVFEVVSPRGLSTFSLVKEIQVQPTSTPVPPTPTPVSTPVPTPEASADYGVSGITVASWLAAFTIGAVASVVTIVFILWIRVR